MDEVNKVGGLAGVDGGVGSEMKRRGFGAFGEIFGDGAGLNHGIEDEVAPIDGALRMAEGVEVVGVLNDAGEHGRLREIELVNVFAEVGLGGFSESVDG